MTAVCVMWPSHVWGCSRGGTARHNGKREQCTAGVGTLLLEFGTLSRLSLDARYEEAALCALRLLCDSYQTQPSIPPAFPVGRPTVVLHAVVGYM